MDITVNEIIILICVAFFGVMAYYLRKHILGSILGEDGIMQLSETIGMYGMILLPMVIFMEISGRFNISTNIYDLIRWMLITATAGSVIPKIDTSKIKRPQQSQSDDPYD